MGDRVRWGILGTGKIARILATALAEFEDGRLVAVGSRDAERAGAFAAEFGVPRASGYEDVLEDPEVDLVYVATHHPFHREWAVAAADAHKHILCEKPMAVTHEHAADRQGGTPQRRVPARGVRVPLPPADRAPPGDPARGRDREGADDRRGLRLRRRARADELPPGARPGRWQHPGRCYTTSMAHLIAAAAAGRSVAPAIDVSGAGSLGPTGVDLHGRDPHVRRWDRRQGRVLHPSQPRQCRPDLRIRGTDHQRPRGSPAGSGRRPRSSWSGGGSSRR